ncbi:MAG: glycosyltransferase family 2 protein [Desulfobulbaceae bacterium]|nr:glycosyltransferase family 2 protein [Desulfobulbaceae bacterium]
MEKEVRSLGNEVKVCAVIVTFYPDITRLIGLLDVIGPQVDSIVIIDNTSSESALVRECANRCESTTYIGTEGNIGIAAAHNRGVEFAQSLSFITHVLLLDQDSTPACDMVECLVRSDNNLRSQGKLVGAVGPQAVNLQTGLPEPLLKKKGWWITKQRCRQGSDSEVYEALYLISSGSLISLDVLAQIGPMDESFFIDLVDVEWGFRSRSKGYLLFVVCAARMTHSVGDKGNLSVIPFRITRHGPERLYYQWRNYFLLVRKRYVFIGWSLYYLVRHLVPRFFIFALVSPPRLLNTKMMLLGIMHGVERKKGARRYE